MFFLFLVPQIISKHFEIDFSDPKQKQYQSINLHALSYDTATITIPNGMALMFIKWDDAIVEFNFIQSSNKKSYTITKDAGLSFFIFKETKVLINASFKTDFSFYVCPIKEVKSNYQYIHFNNMKRETFIVDQTNITNGIAFYTVETYMLSSKQDEVYVTNNYNTINYVPTTYIGEFSYIKCSRCESDVTIYSVSWEDCYPTIPTSIDLKRDEIIDRFDNINYNYAIGNNKMDTIERLNSYKYVFLKNEISDSKKYKLFLTYGNKERVELKKGEVFRRVIDDYSTVDLSIASKKCNENDIFNMITGNQLEINDAGEIVIESITDNDIPNQCKVSDPLSPGIIAAIVIAVIVVVAVIIAVVIIVIRKRKSNKSSQEGNTEKNAENA